MKTIPNTIVGVPPWQHPVGWKPKTMHHVFANHPYRALNQKIVDESRTFTDDSPTCHIVRVVLNAYMGTCGSGAMFCKAHDEYRLPRSDYLESRLEIFKRYTLRSLENQTTSDFHVLVLFDKRLPVESIPSSLGDRLHLVGVDPIDLAKYGSFWNPIPAEDEVIYGIAGVVERLLVTYIDSDDCYMDVALAAIRNDDGLAHVAGCLMVNDGYLYNVDNGGMTSYHDESSPFFTFVYDMERYKAGMRYQAGSCNHSTVAYLMPTKGKGFGALCLVTTHQENDTTSWSVRSNSRERMPPDDVTRTLSRFGI